MSEKDDEYIVINRNTGQVMTELKKGDKIVRKKSIEELQNSMAMNNDFVKLFSSNIMPVIEQLKDGKGKIDYNSLSLMFYLMQFISYKSGLLQHSNGIPLTNEYILGNYDVSRSDFYRSIKSLLDKDIITIVLRVKREKDKIQYYMFNPYIAIKGKRIDKTTLDVFNNTRYEWELDT